MNKQGELFHFEEESLHPEIIIYGDGTLRLDVRMEDYLKQLDSLLTSIGEQVLEHNGHVSHEQAMQKAEREYRIYQQIELSPVERDYLLSIAELKQTAEKGRHKKG